MKAIYPLLEKTLKCFIIDNTGGQFPWVKPTSLQEAVSSKGKPNRNAQAAAVLLLVSNLGWSAEEAKETRARLAALEEDWDTPGMEDYDHL